HFSFQGAQPVMREKKRDEDCRNTDRHEPFVADVSWGVKYQSFGGDLGVKLADERFKRRAFEAQTELRDTIFEKLLVAHCCPFGNVHRAHGITEKSAVILP